MSKEFIITKKVTPQREIQCKANVYMLVEVVVANEMKNCSWPCSEKISQSTCG